MSPSGRGAPLPDSVRQTRPRGIIANIGGDIMLSIVVAILASIGGYRIASWRSGPQHSSRESAPQESHTSGVDAGSEPLAVVPKLDLPPIDPAHYPPHCAAYLKELMRFSTCPATDSLERNRWFVFRLIEIERSVPSRSELSGRAEEDKRCDDELKGMVYHQWRCRSDPEESAPDHRVGSAIESSARTSTPPLIPPRCASYIEAYNRMSRCLSVADSTRAEFARTAAWMRRSYVAPPGNDGEVHGLEAECDLGLRQLLHRYPDC